MRGKQLLRSYNAETVFGLGLGTASSSNLAALLCLGAADFVSEHEKDTPEFLRVVYLQRQPF